MSEKHVVIATFTMPMEAHVACGRLREDGIPAHVTGGGSVSTFAGLGAVGGRVELYVPESACERALDILAECMPGEQWRVMFNRDAHGEQAPDSDWPPDERVKAGSEDLQAEADSRLWVCSLCGDAVSVKETVCPSCGTAREALLAADGGQERGNRAGRRASTTDIQKAESVPAGPSMAADLEVPEFDKYAQGDALARRALYAALLSLLFFPLCIYSFRTMWRVFQYDGEFSPNKIWKIYVAFALNLVLAALVAAIVFGTRCGTF